MKLAREVLFGAAVVGTFALAYRLSAQSFPDAQADVRGQLGSVRTREREALPRAPAAEGVGVVRALRLPPSEGTSHPPTTPIQSAAADAARNTAAEAARTTTRTEIPAEALLDPLPERNRLLEKLRASGPDELDLTAAAAPVQSAWREILESSGIDASFSPWECFREGCTTTVVHGTSDVVDEFSESLTRANAFRSWNGGKIKSGNIERPDERVEVTWILLAPFREPAQADTAVGNGAGEQSADAVREGGS